MTVQILVALITASGGVIAALVPLLLKARIKRRKRSEQESWKQHFTLVHEVYTTLSVMLKELGAARVLVLRSENGGGLPQPGAQLYSSVVYEAVNPPLQPIRGQWQGQQIDQEYITLLENVCHTKYVCLDTTEMVEESLLGNLYRAHGITFAEVALLQISKGHVLYLSINYDRALDKDDPSHRESFRVGYLRLRQIFEQMQEVLPSS